jgi:hypothetical protein
MEGITDKTMSRRQPSIRYRIRLLLTAFVLASAVVVVMKVGSRNSEMLSPVDFLEPQAFLSSSKPSVDPSLIFLGSSSVAGVGMAAQRSMPALSTQSLAMARGNLLGYMALASQSRVFHPKTLVVELDSTAFLFNPHWAPSAVLNAELLRGYVPKDLFERVRGFRSWRFEAFYRTLSLLEPFNRFLKLVLSSYSSRDAEIARPVSWRDRGLDPYWDLRSTQEEFSLLPYAVDLLKGFERLASDGGSKLVVYISPFRLYSHDDSEIRDQLSWRQEMGKVLNELGITHFDYFDLFFDRQEYPRGFFRDRDHLLPRGSAVFAGRLLADLEQHSLIGRMEVTEEQVADPCSAEIRRYCPEVPEGDQESCLLEHFDRLEMSCKKSELISLTYDSCYLDRLRLCQGIRPEHWGSCLSGRIAELSPRCRAVLAPQSKR